MVAQNPIAQTFDSRNPDALRRRNLDPRGLLRAKSITPDLLSDAIYGRTEIEQAPGYHSEAQKTALEAGKAPELARADHSHDLTYLHEGLARDKATDDSDWSNRILTIDAGVAPPYDRPERRMVLWTFDPDRPFASSPVLVYCSMSLDAGVTWGNYDLVGAGAANTDCLIYEAVQWPWADTTNTVARYRVMLPKVDRSAAMKLTRTGTDGKLDVNFLPAGPANWHSGAGSPESVLAAPVGDGYLDTTNGAIYIKATGTGNTGWKYVYRAGGTDVPVTDGGTGASDAATARSNLGCGTVATLDSDTDTTLAANSDARVATQKATKAYVDAAVTGLLDFKGSTDCSGNPNYPAASKGDAYIVSVAGKIGGASGKSVDIGDAYLAIADNAGGTEAAVGTSWSVLEHNLVGALLAANNLSDLANAATARTNLGLGALAVKNTVATGDIDAGAVGNSQMADMAQATIKGRASGAGTGAPTDLSPTQATAILNAMVGDSGAGGTKGLVAAPAAGDAAAGKFWKADGTWAAPTVASSDLFSAIVAKTANYTIVSPTDNGTTFDCDSSGGAFTMTLPTAPSTGFRVAIMRRAGTSAALTVTVQAGGADVIRGPRSTAGTSFALQLYESVVLTYYATPGVWLAAAHSSTADAGTSIASLRTLGTGANQACAGSDARLSDTRIPTDASVSEAKLTDAVWTAIYMGV